MIPESGTLLVHAEAVAPGMRIGAPNQKMIDLAPFAGREIELTRSGVRKVLGASHDTIKTLVRLGVIRRRGRFLLIDPATDGSFLYEAWVTRFGERMRHREFKAVRQVRSLCHIPRSQSYPEAVRRAAVIKLLQLRSWYNAEINGLLTVEPDRLKEERKILRGLANQLARSRTPLPQGVDPPSEFFLDAHPFLGRCSRTCFADWEQWAEPSRRARLRAWTAGPASAPIALYMFLAAAGQRRAAQVDQAVALLLDFDRAFARNSPGGSLQDPEAIRATLEQIIADDTMAESRRELVCRTWLELTRALRLYAADEDRDGSIGLASVVPAEPTGRGQIIQALKTNFGHLRPEGRLRRKERSNFLADRLLRIETVATLRMEQICHTGTKLRAAAERLASDEKHLSDRYVEEPIYTTVLDHRGELVGHGVQRCIWRVWREEAFVRLLAESGRARQQRGLKDRVAAFDAAHGSGEARYVYEFVRCESVLGAPTREPWFVTVDRLGLLVSPSLLTPRQAHKRHQTLIQWKLPALQSRPAGLLGPTEHETLIWCAAADQRRCVVHIDNQEHALRFAHAAFAGVGESFGRLHEILQQVQDQNGWTTKPTLAVREPDGKAKEIGGWKAFYKIGRDKELAEEPGFFPASLVYMAEIQELAAMTAARGGHVDGLLPVLAPWDDLAHKVAPGPFIFQSGGRVLLPTEIHLFMRFLFAGWPRFTCHDLRHALANAMRSRGVSGPVISAALGHEDPDMWEWYAAWTERQREERRRFGEDERLRTAVDLHAYAGASA